MSSSIRKLIGAKLKAHRVRLKLNQAAVAEALDCEIATISRYERGEYSPDGERLVLLGQLFGVSPLEFLPTQPEAHWQDVSDLRGTLIDLVHRITDPIALQNLIASAKTACEPESH